MALDFFPFLIFIILAEYWTEQKNEETGDIDLP
jgi:hypothetical protein